jgi:hypothetical protein
MGSNVLMNGSGSFNTGSLSLNGSTGNFSPVITNGTVACGSTTAANSVAYYNGAAPTPLLNALESPALSSVGASTGSGAGLVLQTGFPFLGLPAGYVSGASFSFSDTYNNITLSQIGLNVGTFSLSWGSGATADSLTVYSGVAVPVPESSSSLLLTTLGFAIVCLLRPKFVA